MRKAIPHVPLALHSAADHWGFDVRKEVCHTEVSVNVREVRKPKRTLLGYPLAVGGRWTKFS